MDDPYHISGSDHPGMQLTTKPFNGSNYPNWSRSVRMALGAKSKIGFIDGTIAKPTDGSTETQKWVRSDYMVRCWLLNSLMPEISDSFMYAQSAKELWDEITERFGEANGALIYQLHRELTLLSQDNDPLSLYFSKMKKLWDELQDIDALPACSCGVINTCKCDLLKRLQEKESRNQLLQFLMGLNSGYDTVKGQILAMDPLPTVNRAYYIIQQIERQRQISGVMQGRQETEGYNVQKQGFRSTGKRDIKKGKNDRFCDHCKIKGHQTDQCFKIYGYPEWYKEKYGAKMKAAAHVDVRETTTQKSPFECSAAASVQKSPLECSAAASASTSELVNAVCQEVLKALQHQVATGDPLNFTPKVNSDAHSGPYF